MVPRGVVVDNGHVALLAVRRAQKGPAVRRPGNGRIVGLAAQRGPAQVLEAVHSAPWAMKPRPSLRAEAMPSTWGTWLTTARTPWSLAAVTTTWPPLNELPHRAMRSPSTWSRPRTKFTAERQSASWPPMLTSWRGFAAALAKAAVVEHQRGQAPGGEVFGKGLQPEVPQRAPKPWAMTHHGRLFTAHGQVEPGLQDFAFYLERQIQPLEAHHLSPHGFWAAPGNREITRYILGRKITGSAGPRGGRPQKKLARRWIAGQDGRGCFEKLATPPPTEAV